MSSIIGMSVLTGCTGLTPVGGSAVTLGKVGADNNGVVLAVASEAYNVRTQVIFKSKASKLQPDGSYSKLKRHVQVSKAKLLADGTPTFATLRFEVEAHPEWTDAEILGLICLATQCYTDSESADFRTAGSVS